MDLKKETVDRIRQYCKENEITYLGIFGSVARGTSTERSDVDIMIRVGKRIGLFALIGIQIDLEEIIGKKVDLVTEGHLHPMIEENALNDMETLYEAA